MTEPMKTNVEITMDDAQYKEFKKGERGYIDGYVQGGDGAPYVAVVIGDRIILVKTYQVKVLQSNHPQP